MKIKTTNIKNIIILLFTISIISSCQAEKQPSITQDIHKSQEKKTELEVIPVIENENKKEEVIENFEGLLFDCNNMNAEEKEMFLTGAWELFFPTPAGNWGHRFRANNIYRYVDLSDNAAIERFWFTDGRWRIVDDFIQVNFESYRISDRDAIETPFGLNFPSDTEYITVLIDDDTWYTIGTFASIRIGIVHDGLEYPPRITLHPILFDKVLEEEQYYYRDRP